jgi:hypothetical protein
VKREVNVDVVSFCGGLFGKGEKSVLFGIGDKNKNNFI